jgi:hypothetical protein
MEPLIIKETQSTPSVVFDKAEEKLELSGNSLPEDVMAFYSPVIDWLEKYCENPNHKTILTVKLYYFNSASSKVILDILAMMDQLIKDGHTAQIDWHYLEIDEDMLSTGKEYAEMLTSLPFNFISYMQ